MDRLPLAFSPERIRVFLLCGHEPVSRALSELLREEGFDVVGEAGSTAEALSCLPGTAPHVALLGNRLADGTGIEACRALREAAPATRCIIVTTYDGQKALRAAVMADAAGHVLQSARADGLPEAIRRAAAGQRLHSARAARAVLNGLGAATLPGGAPGSERAILSLIVQGRTDAEIMTELALPHESFSALLSALLARLGYRAAPNAPTGQSSPPPRASGSHPGGM